MFFLPGAGKTVLITGVNGYIASNIALKLLRRGYFVRGTSRSPSAERRLLKGPFKGYENSYDHYIVSDITVPGTFDDAVQGLSHSYDRL
jgi:nucleoside-diphosphate-sugar epimerase